MGNNTMPRWLYLHCVLVQLIDLRYQIDAFLMLCVCQMPDSHDPWDYLFLPVVFKVTVVISLSWFDMFVMPPIQNTLYQS
jgi:hypothetical protein